LLDGIFYSRLVCILNGNTVEIDSRTSDALAMAVRFECPIYTYEFILDAAGVVLEEGEEGKESKNTPKKERKKNTLKDYSIEQLNQMLDEVLEKEDYEKAAEIRDEMNRRETQG
jgi:bifunctional DNase/RNase